MIVKNSLVKEYPVGPDACLRVTEPFFSLNKSCAVRMRNAIQRNELNNHNDKDNSEIGHLIKIDAFRYVEQRPRHGL